MKEIKLLSLTNNKNNSKCEELSNNKAEFNDNSTKNVEIKKRDARTASKRSSTNKRARAIILRCDTGECSV